MPLPGISSQERSPRRAVGSSPAQAPPFPRARRSVGPAAVWFFLFFKGGSVPGPLPRGWVLHREAARRQSPPRAGRARAGDGPPRPRWAAKRGDSVCPGDPRGQPLAPGSAAERGRAASAACRRRALSPRPARRGHGAAVSAARRRTRRPRLQHG